MYVFDEHVSFLEWNGYTFHGATEYRIQPCILHLYIRLRTNTSLIRMISRSAYGFSILVVSLSVVTYLHTSYGRMQTLRTSCVRIVYNPFTVLHTSRYTGAAYARRSLARSIRHAVMIYSHKLLLNYSGIQTYSSDFKMFIYSSRQARSKSLSLPLRPFSCSWITTYIIPG